MVKIKQEDNIAATKASYRAQEDYWDMIDALCSTTKGMRAAGEKYNPKYEDETDEKYKARTKRTFLFEAFKDTLDRAESKAFHKSIILENVPDDLMYLETDCDGKGKTITQYGKEVYRNSIKYGIDFIFVDFPTIENPNAQTKKDEEFVRATLLRISARNMLFWRVDNIDGIPVLQEIRFKEFVTVPDGEYSEKTIEQIKVYTRHIVIPDENGADVILPGKWEIWRKNEKKEWILYKEDTHTFGEIPVIPVYSNYKEYFVGVATLLKLAYKNVEHWVISSDLNWSLYYQTGVWWVTGITTKEKDNLNLTVGPGKAKGFTNPDATIQHTEPGGKAVDYLQTKKSDIEQEMASLGAEPFMSLRVNVKATGQIQDQEKANNDIEAWVTNLEAQLELAIKYAGQWKGIETPDDMKVNIRFDPTVITGKDDMTHVQYAHTTQVINNEQYVIEAQRRGILSENVNAENAQALSPDGDLDG
jgi:hypothetical protein